MIGNLSITEGRKILRDSATEAQIQDAITSYLRAQRIPHSITESKRSFNEYGQLVRRIAPGWPDITGCARGGIMLAIECKSAKGRLRPEQARTLHALYQAGALVVIARSVDCVIEVLRTWRIRTSDIDEICRYKDKPVKTSPRRSKTDLVRIVGRTR